MCKGCSAKTGSKYESQKRASFGYQGSAAYSKSQAYTPSSSYAPPKISPNYSGQKSYPQQSSLAAKIYATPIDYLRKAISEKSKPYFKGCPKCGATMLNTMSVCPFCKNG